MELIDGGEMTLSSMNKGDFIGGADWYDLEQIQQDLIIAMDGSLGGEHLHGDLIRIFGV